MKTKEAIDHYTIFSEKWTDYLTTLTDQVEKSRYLPSYHLYPKTGLMNDPNGLSYFNGNYHVFYQWFPFDSFHGLKHWGHAVSKDLVQFEDQSPALIPTESYEKNGAYSGNAFEHEGKLYLFYTANYKTPQGKKAKQALAIMDEHGEIKKYPGNPIIEGTPEQFSEELRDPFVFQRDDAFYMLLGGGRFTQKEQTGFGDRGELLLYQSENLFDWHYQGTIELPIDTGYMLECPSLVTIDGKDILFLSPMGLEKETARFQNRFASIYLVGELDLKERIFRMDSFDELDAGFDFYAPQSFYGQDQQPLMLGWFGCGMQEYPNDHEGWKHGLTTPQTIKLRENQLCRFPVKDLLNAFQKIQIVKNSSIPLAEKNCRLTLEITEDTQIRLGTKEDFWIFDIAFERGELRLDRSNLRQPVDTAYGVARETKMTRITSFQLDIFVDNSFVEIYVNHGERVFSFRAFIDAEQFTVTFDKPHQTQLAYFEAQT